ncbi:MAG: hypothetical protein IAF38_03065 [Bacteroidia bacterium]|nr:hypothetical protein [Bacteroidia bacterium]
MRLKLFSLFSLLILFTKAQFPEFISNTNSNDSFNSALFSKTFKNFDFILAYKIYSNGKYTYKLLGNSNKVWKKIEFSFDPGSKKIKQKKEISNQSQDTLKRIVSKFSEKKFWNLENDSLNIKYFIFPDSSVTVVRIQDCFSETFEIFSKKLFRIENVECPDGYSEAFPGNRQLKTFIECRDIF